MDSSFQFNLVGETAAAASVASIAQTPFEDMALASSSPPTPPVVMLDPFYDELRTSTRFWVQRVAVPCITLVGLFGNAITIIIMTRRRMRSTTNMYLAALAFVDMLYLVLTFLLGIRHYPHVDTPSWYAYWRLRPFLNMLTDACSNTSVWLTVTFTIERFIAVKYPMKGKVWCTEARAKKLIVGVFVFGILFASPVPFEWKVTEKVIVTPGKQVATYTRATPAPDLLLNKTIGQLEGGTHFDLYGLPKSNLLNPADWNEKAEGDLGRDWNRQVDNNNDDLTVREDLRMDAKERNMNRRSSGTETSQQSRATDDLAKDKSEQEEEEKEEEEVVQVVLALEKTEFGLNETYKTIYYWSTAVIFCFVPLILLTLFNGFLIRSVHSSRRKRNLMTNTRATTTTTTGQQAQTQTRACQFQRGLSVRDHLRKQGNKLGGRARLLIKRRNSNSETRGGQVEKRQDECKSASGASEPPKSKVIIRPSRSNSPPNTTSRTSDHVEPTLRQHTTVGLRNSIIKLPPGQTGVARHQCANACAKVTFRQTATANSWQQAYDYRDPSTATGEFPHDEYRRRPPPPPPPMPIVNEKVNVSDIERGELELGPASVDFARSSNCDTCDATDDSKRLWAANSHRGSSEGELPVSHVEAQANSALAISARQTCACLQPPGRGHCDLTTGNQRAPPSLANRLDDIGDKGAGSVVVVGPMENLQQSKLTLGRSRSAYGAGGANGRFVGGGACGGCVDNNNSRLHQQSLLIFGNRSSSSGSGGKGSKSGMSNDASSMGNHNDNGMTMVHASSGASTQPSHPQAAASSQERRITIMLIAVVILFLVCQIPSAAMLLYTSVHEPQPNTNEDALLLICGNIFNLLMAVNAAGNFILYSFLSKKYRDTFVTTFCKCTWGRRGKALAKSRGGYLAGGLERQSTTSQGRTSRDTSTTQHLVSSYQSTTTGGGNSSTSSDDTTRCSTPASLVRFCKNVRAKATSHRATISNEPANTQPLQSGQLGNGRHNLL